MQNKFVTKKNIRRTKCALGNILLKVFLGITILLTPKILSAQSTDTIAPSAPANLRATIISTSQVDLQWDASTDNVGVVGYKIFQGTTLLATVTSGTSYSHTGLKANTSYSYAISAYDLAGNPSSNSPPLTVTTYVTAPRPGPQNANTHSFYLMFTRAGNQNFTTTAYPISSGITSLELSLGGQYAAVYSFGTFRLQLLVDNAPVGPIYEVKSFPLIFNLDTTKLTDGTHALSIKLIEAPSTAGKQVYFPRPSLIVINNIPGAVIGQQTVPICPSWAANGLPASGVSPVCTMIPVSGVEPNRTDFPQPIVKGIPFTTQLTASQLFVENILPFTPLYTPQQRLFQISGGHIVSEALWTQLGDKYEGAAKAMDNLPLSDGPRNTAYVSAYTTGSVHPITEELIFAEQGDKRGRIGKVSLDGTLTTIAGYRTKKGFIPYSPSDASIPQTTRDAQYELVGNFTNGPIGFKRPMDVIVDPRDSNILYVADSQNHRIAKIDTTTMPATVSTYAGSTAGIKGLRNSVGTDALFNEPFSIAMTNNGTMYVADRGNSLIRQIDTAGNVITLVGQGYKNVPTINSLRATASGTINRDTHMINGDFSLASVIYPMSIRLDSKENIIMVENFLGTIRKIDVPNKTIALVVSIGISEWIWADVNRDGTFGPIDNIFFVSGVYGGTFGGPINEQILQVTADGSKVTTMFAGSYNLSTRLNNKRAAHYTWMVAVGKGAIWNNGFGSDGMLRIRKAQTSDRTDGGELYYIFNPGRAIIESGTVPNFPFGARQSFGLLHGSLGWNLLGAEPTFDDLGTLSDQQLTQKIQSGWGTGQPRPEITGRDLRNLIYYIRRMSLGTMATAAPGPDPADKTAPVISNIIMDALSQDTVRIKWKTNEPTLGLAHYGEASKDYALWSPVENSYALDHEIIISPLISGKTYYYIIRSKDDAGNQSTTAEATFSATGGTADVSAPTVSLSSPANNSTVSGSNVLINANASDDIGVVGVQFKLDGNNLGAEKLLPPYSFTWDSTKVSNGTHTLTAIARDAAGKTTVSSPLTVTTSNDLTAPTVTLSAPAQNATVSGTSVTVSANATDLVGIVGVQFKLDGSNLGVEDTTSPYGVVLDSKTIPNGSHTLSAVARDAAGNFATASLININVSNTVASLPTVKITSPSASQILNGTSITVNYSESGDLSLVDHVHLQLDAQPEVRDTDNDGTYTFTNVVPGAHTVRVYLAKSDHSKLPNSEAETTVSFSNKFSIADLGIPIRAIKDGNWSDPTVWETGSLPNFNNAVIINNNVKVTYDLPFNTNNTAEARSITIDQGGALRFSRSISTRMDLDGSMIVLDGGTLDIGTPADPIPASLKTSLGFNVGNDRFFTGNLTPGPLPGMADYHPEDVGLWAMGAATVTIHGAPKNRIWIKLAADAAQGTSTLKLIQSPQGWRVGDTILMTPTGINPDEFETRTITAINGNTLTINQPLSFTHQGKYFAYDKTTQALRSISANTVLGANEILISQAGEVALLSQNVTIASNLVTANDPNHRSHSALMHGVNASIAYAEFKDLGPRAILGRYPLHFHKMGSVQNGLTVTGVSIWSSIPDPSNKWIAIHASENVTVKDCVGFNAQGKGFYMEDAQEIKNVLDGNLGARVVSPEELPNVKLNTSNPTIEPLNGNGIFWVRMGNTVRNNVAVGAQSSVNGFMLTPSVLSGGVSLFEKNESHSNATGLYYAGASAFSLINDQYSLWKNAQGLSADAGVTQKTTNSIFSDNTVQPTSDADAASKVSGTFTGNTYLTTSSVTPGRVLQVGPTRTLKAPSAAAAIVQDGDTIEIDAGTYLGDVAVWSKNNLTLKGVGGMAHLKANGQNAQGKGIWVVYGTNFTAMNIEFSEATVVDQNGAGIRHQGKNLTVKNCYFHDNEDGILGGGGPGSSVVIENTEFARNGYGDGQSHNLYIDNVDSLTFVGNYSHQAKIGHELKSRAKVNYILYNRLSNENGTASYNIDLSNGGLAYIIGNLIEQGPGTDNSTLVTFAPEGATNPQQELYVVNNTFVNNYSGGIFVRVNGTPVAKVINNLFIGPGTAISGTAQNITNLSTTNPGLVDKTNFDYHLLASSVAIDAGTDPGLAGTFNLTPSSEYNHPLSSTPRDVSGTKIDIGAYEYKSSSSDTIFPTVSVTAPANSATVSGAAVNVAANAADNIGIAGVQFKLDGNILATEDTTSPYSIVWDSTKVSNGTHSLTAVARDTTGNTTTSAAVSVSVSNVTADATPPSVPQNLLASPASSSQMNLSWSASSDNVGVTGYKIFRNTIQIATTTSINFQDSGLSPDTTYTYNVSAYDAAGNHSAQTAAVSAKTLIASANPIDNLKPGEWYRVPNSNMTKVGFQWPPGIAYGSSLHDVMGPWSGGAYDSKRDRLIVWGGGHGNYAGNEIYVFDINKLAWERVSDPSLFTDPQSTTSTSGYYPDSTGKPDLAQPRARHTYNYIQYVPSIDQFCSFGSAAAFPGAIAPSGIPLDCFDFTTKRWTKKKDSMPTIVVGSYSAYDPKTGHVFARGTNSLYFLAEWDPLTDTWTRISQDNGRYTYYQTAAIDPVNRKLFAVGPGEFGAVTEMIDISKPGPNVPYTIANTTGDKAMEKVAAPGLDYDPVTKKIVAWSGGTDVYTLDPITLVWTKITPAATNTVIPTAAAGAGTYGRFRYVPSKNVFIVVNAINQDVYIYKLSAGNGTIPTPPADTSAPLIPQGLIASPASASQINLSWSASSDNVGVSGYKIFRNGLQIATSASTNFQDTGLAADTTYPYTVSAYDAAGNNSAQSTSVSAKTNAAPVSDTTAPTVSISAPTNNASVSGASVIVSANASDNIAVVGVQFKLDGNILGAEDTASPYSIVWDSTKISNGTHSLTAVARDSAGNSATSAAVSVNVANTTAAFAINDRIQTNKIVNVNSAPAGGTLLGTQPLNALGTIIAGPNPAGDNIYWQIDFDSGLDGWVAQRGFNKIVSSDTISPSTPQNIKAQFITNPNATTGGKLTKPFSQFAMNDNAANSTIVDSGTGLLHLSASVNTSALSSSGKISQAITLNGSDQFMNADQFFQGIKTDSIGSFSFWIKPTASGTILSLAGTDGSLSIDWNLSLKAIILGISGGSTPLSFYAGNIPDGIFSHVVITQDGQNIKLYVNGVQQNLNYWYQGNKGAWFSFINSERPKFGRVGVFNTTGNNSSNLQYFKGALDDLRYYKSALSSSDVSLLYNGGAGTEALEPSSATSSYQINLSWDAATDNVGVTGYKIYRDGNEIASTTTNSYTDKTVQPAVTYVYKVLALDLAGNLSPFSNNVSVNSLDTTAPSAPQNLTAQFITNPTGGTGTVKVTKPSSEFTFNDNASTTVVIDSGSAATPISSTVNTNLLSTPGKINQSFVLNGTDQFINADKFLGTIKTDSVGSFTFWIKPVASGTIMSFAGSVGSMSIDWNASMQALIFGLSGESTPLSFSTGNIPAETFAHIAIVQDGQNIKVYVNGVLQTLNYWVQRNKGAWFSFINAAQLNFGRFGVFNSTGNLANNIQFFKGSLDDLRYYKTALSAMDVSILYNGGAGTEALEPSLSTPSSQVNLAWSASTDNVAVMGYKIYRDGNEISSSSINSFSDQNVLPTAAYSYKVMAFDAAGNLSAFSNIVSMGVSDTQPPTVPQNLSAAPASTSQINLSWNVATDNVSVTGYKVFRNGTQVGTPITNSYQDTGLNANTTYVYTVLAVDAAGNNSAQSASVSAKTNIATDTTAPTVSMSAPSANATVSGSSVAVSANAADNVGVAGVQFKLDGNLLGSEDTSSPYSIVWDSTKVSNGTHLLTAVARDATGNTTTSTAVSVSVSNVPTDSTPPSVPQNILATALSSSQINLSWNAATDNVGVTGYKIFRNGTQVATAPSNTFQDSGLAANTTYPYTISSFDAAGNNSAQSTAASAKTLASGGRVLQVGPQRTLKTPSAAAAIALDGDTIEIDAGVYLKDVALWTKNNLTLRGVGGMAHLKSGGKTYGDKGIWVTAGNNTTIEYIEFSEAVSSGANGAGIRHEGIGLTIRHCYFHDNQDGILTKLSNPLDDILIEYSEFARNGDGSGQSHNMYINHSRSFTLRYCYSHDAIIGHLVKTRALTNYILYNRLTNSPTGSASYEIDIPDGGTSYIIGNLIQQSPAADNTTLFSYAMESRSNPNQDFYLINNSFVTDVNGTFVQYRGTPISKILNNIWVGNGTVLVDRTANKILPDPADNLKTNSPGFIDQTSFNYRLASSSPAINKGLSPGVVNGVDLTPVSQYLFPTDTQNRTIIGSAIDMGAFEFGINAPTAPIPAPEGLRGILASPTSIKISWDPSLDENHTILEYRVFRDGTQITAVKGLTYTDAGLAPGTSYTYTIIAVNDVGTTSAASKPLMFATPRVVTAAPIPAASGWYELDKTKLRSVCPSDPAIFGTSGCGAVVDGWSGGAFDTKRNRLIIWGGGLTNYLGNEIYALNLDSLTVERLTDPGLPPAVNFGPAVETLVNGTQPNARATADGLTYMENVDRLFSFGGELAGSTVTSAETWTFDFSTKQWQQMKPSGTVPAGSINPMAAYDPNSGKVFVHNLQYLYSYDFATNAYTRLGPQGGVDYRVTSVIDPVQKKFVMVGGGGVWVYDIGPGSTYTIQSLATTGGDDIVKGYHPGLSFDPVSKHIIAWQGGDTVYSLDINAKTWTPISYPAGPVAAGTGTFKRWNFSPKDGVFIVINSVDRNANALRLGPISSNPDTQAPSVPQGLTASAASTSQINLSWNASNDNVGVSGYKIFRNGSQIATSGTTSFQDTGLQADTTYPYTVSAYDAAGNNSAQSTSVSAKTNAAPVSDTTPPTVSMSAPSANSTVSGATVAVSANALDNIGVAGVQFKLDGNILGAEDTSSPYSIIWDSTKISNGTHSLTAVARDTTGNTTTSTAVSVSVNNVTADSTPPSVPQNLLASAASSSQMNLSWSASSDNVGVTGYKIFRNTIQIATTTTTTFQDSGLAANTSYSYAISAYDAAGNDSLPSSAVSAATKGAVSGVFSPGARITTTATKDVLIYFMPSTQLSQGTQNSGISGSIVGGPQQDNGSTWWNIDYDSGPDGWSTDANLVLATADTTAPTIPLGLTVTPASFNQMDLQWLASSDNVPAGIIRYQIYRNGTLIMTTASRNYQDTELIQNTDYTYTLKAIDLAGNLSALSAPVTKKTPLKPATNPIDSLKPGEWYRVPGSAIKSSGILYQWPPSVVYGSTFPYIAESGGAYDTKRDLMMIWGGGHGNYAGNEIYAFDVNSLKWQRLMDPSLNTDYKGALLKVFAYPDSNGNIDIQPRVPHSYNTMQYIPQLDSFCVFGNSGAPFPAYSAAPPLNVDPSLTKAPTWCFDIASRQWTRRAPVMAAGIESQSAYDPVSGHIWVKGTGTDYFVAQWDPNTDTWSKQTGFFQQWGYLNTSDIDPKRRMLVSIAGCGWGGCGDLSVALASSYTVDISQPLSAPVPLDMTGATTISSGIRNPGVAYDPVSDRIVVWNGGTDVYTLNLDTRKWTHVPPAATNTVIPPAPVGQGTFGRFRYIPSKNVFILINTVTDDVYFYKFSPGNGTPNTNDTQNPTIPTNLTATVASSSSINLSWSAATDNVGVSGYKIFRNGSQIATSASTNFQDTGLAADTTYPYTVSAYDAAGNNSAQSTSVSAKTNAAPVSDTTAPTVSISAPAANATVSGASVTVSANAADAVGVVGVQFKLDGANLGAEDTASPYSITWDSTKATNGTHSITAIARDAAGNSTTSAAVSITVSNTTADTAAPSIPQNLAATAVSATQINLTWTASTDNVGVTGYKVYRNGNFLQSVTTTNFQDSGLTPDTTYSYTVSAFDLVANNSNQSTLVSAKTLIPPVNPIDSLKPGEWYEVPNSKMRGVAFQWPVNAQPYGWLTDIMGAWSSGAYDTKRERLIVWGGGHAGYSGNEIYAFDINSLKWQRLSTPSLLMDHLGIWLPSGEYPDIHGNPDPGQPRASHTYNYLQYIPEIDRMCSMGLAAAYPTYSRTGIIQVGYASGAAYCFDSDTGKWEKKNEDPYASIGSYTAYDPTTGHIFQKLTNGSSTIGEWDPNADTWTQRSGWLPDYDYDRGAAIDFKRRKLVVTGNGRPTQVFDLNTTSQLVPSNAVTSGDKTIESIQAPGFVYDPVSDKFVGWAGGANVFTLDPVSFVWTKISPASTNVVIPTNPPPTGTNGRFRYIPSKNVFIVVNSVDQNVYIYKLSAGSGTLPAGDVTVPSTPTDLKANNLTPSKVKLSWTRATDNVGIAGYEIYRNGLLVGTTGNTFYSDTTISPSTLYSYTVKAYDPQKNISGHSLAASITTLPVDTQSPSVPTNLKAFVISSTQISITWTPSVDNVGVLSYKIFRDGIDVGRWNAIPLFQDLGLAPNKTYSYTVAAYDDSGNVSAVSSPITATTLASNPAADTIAPSVPKNLKATALSSTQVQLTWDASTDNNGSFVGYRIYRNGTSIMNVVEPSYKDENLKSSTTYTYSVLAIDPSYQYAGASTPVSITTP